MNRRWLIGRLPDPADLRRRLGVAGAGSDGAAERSWRARWRGWLGRALCDPALWLPTRRSVSGGVATGLFVSWMPVPLQMVLAAILASALRVHVPVSVVMVWFTNPLTIAPLLYAAWRTGSTLLGEPAIEPVAPSVQAVAEAATEAALQATAVQVTANAAAEGLASGSELGRLLAGLGDAWSAVLVGCLFWACVTALAGFVATRVLWRVAAVRRWRDRAARRAARRAVRRAVRPAAPPPDARRP